MSCNVEGCEEDELMDGQCDEHLAESYGKDGSVPVLARVADKIHYMLQKHGGECFELTNDRPLCLEIAIYLDEHGHLMEDE